MLRAATDRGEPVYVRFPDGAEVQGHRFKWGEDTTGDDTEGHGGKFYEDQTGDDTEGHGGKIPQVDETGDDVEGHRLNRSL